MSDAAGQPAPPPEFPGEDLLELLRAARSGLPDTYEGQLAFVESLQVSPEAVWPPAGRPVAGRHESAEGRPVIQAPALPGRARDPDGADAATGEPELMSPAEAIEAADRPDEPFGRQAPPPTGDVPPAHGSGTVLSPDEPRPALRGKQFATALVRAVAAQPQLGSALALARRAQGTLPPDERDRWDELLGVLERVHADARRRADAAERAPDLSQYAGWAGFECLHEYSLTDRFFGRAAYLARLDEWVDAASDGDAAVMCVTALGGAGKSALAWHWVNGALPRLRRAGFRGVLWTSFYERTFDFEDFLRRALAFCGGREFAAVERLPRAEVERDLLEIVRWERWVVVIDGLERLMSAYTQVAQRAADDEGTRGSASLDDAAAADRRLNDPRDAAFLAALAVPLASRVLVTTRLLPADLEQDGGLRPHIAVIDLPGLNLADAVELWRDLAPLCPLNAEIRHVFDVCLNHPLAISILARSVAAAGGDWEQWRRAEAHRGFAPPRRAAEARAHVIEICLLDLGPDAVDALNMLAVTGKPMTLTELETALRESSIATGEERWTAPGRAAAELDVLVMRGFVGRAAVDGETQFDVHPVVRGTMWSSMTGPGRSRRERFVDQALSELGAIPDSQQPMEPVQLRRGASIFELLVATGQWDRAWEMFRYRLWWPLYSAGAYRELLDLFRLLLPGGDPLQLLPLASRREQADAAEMLADRLMAVGQGDEADTLLLWTGVIRWRINDLLGFLDVRRHRTWQSLYEGRLFEAELELRLVKLQAIRAGAQDLFQTVDLWIGLVLALRGDTGRARVILDAARGRRTEDVRWWRQGAAEGHLYLEQYDEAVEALAAAADADEDGEEPSQVAWELLTRGMAMVGAGDLAGAREQLYRALHLTRKLDYRIVECFAVPSLAQVELASGDHVQAAAQVDQYFELDPDSRFRLAATDAWWVRAQCAMAAGDRAAARSHAAEAYRLAACDGPPFVYAARMRRARAMLEQLGAYLPRTETRLAPDWAPDLRHLETQAARLEAEMADEQLRQTQPGHPVLDPEPDAALTLRAVEIRYVAAEPDARWWNLVTGGNPLLTIPLTELMETLGIGVAELRAEFERSTHKSLEVLYYQLYADHLLKPHAPRRLAELDPAARERWLADTAEHERMLGGFLTTDRAEQAAAPFQYQGLDDRGHEAFLADCQRRIRVAGASEEARRWWTQLCRPERRWEVLILAECIQSASATLDEFVDAMSTTGDHGLEFGFLTLLARQAEERLEITQTSRTEGWTETQVQLRLQVVKYQLGWMTLATELREFWTELERKNASYPGRALQLAEELAIRGSTIAAYYDACVRSGSESPMATLCYLDYVRLAAEPWAGDGWPDDVSAGRWSYDVATPTFTDVSGWTADKAAKYLETLRARIRLDHAGAAAATWWRRIEAAEATATMVRLAQELLARQSDVDELYDVRVAAGTDNLLAVLAYLDFTRLEERPAGDDRFARATAHNVRANELFDAGDLAGAVAEYEAAIEADPTQSVFYLNLARAWEDQIDDPGLSRERALDALRRGAQRSPGDAELTRELQRVTLHLPREVITLKPTILVEVSDTFAAEGSEIVKRVDLIRTDLLRETGVLLPGVRFVGSSYLMPGHYTVAIRDALVARGETVPGSRFTAGDPPGTVPGEDPVDGSAGGWSVGTDTGLTPSDYLLRHLRAILDARLADILDEQLVVQLIADSWSPTVLDPVADIDIVPPFTEVLRTLLDDGLRLVDADLLLAEFRRRWAAGDTVAAVARHLRRHPALRPQLPGNRPGDTLVPLDPGLEQRIAAGLAAAVPPGPLVLRPQTLHELLLAVRTAVPEQGPGRRDVLLVTDPDVRRPIRVLLRPEFPGLPVIARGELEAGDAR